VFSERSEPGLEFPSLFSDQLNELIDVMLGECDLHIENENYRYLAERSFITTKYSYGEEITNRVVVTSKGLNFLVKCKLGNYDKLRFDRTNSINVIHLLAALITGNVGTLKSFSIPMVQLSTRLYAQRLAFLGLIKKDPFRVTSKGGCLIKSYLSRHSEDVVLDYLAGDDPWWREFLAKEIPLFEWASLMVKLSPDDSRHPEVNEAMLERRKQFAELLRPR